MNMKRFERQIMLQEIGVEGQAALANASVLIVGREDSVLPLLFILRLPVSEE